jgi:hypothetical protein
MLELNGLEELSFYAPLNRAKLMQGIYRTTTNSDMAEVL